MPRFLLVCLQSSSRGSPIEAHKAHTLLRVALEGLRYLQTYDWLFLRTIVSVGYLGWIAYAPAIASSWSPLDMNASILASLPSIEFSW
jgi:hypothetical protein